MSNKEIKTMTEVTIVEEHKIRGRSTTDLLLEIQKTLILLNDLITQLINLIDTQYKFSTASLFLDGNSDYVPLPDSADWTFGMGDFTTLSPAHKRNLKR